MDLSNKTKEEIIKIVSKKASMLAYVPEELKEDEDVVLAAIKKDVKSIIFTRKWFDILKDEKNIVEAMINYINKDKLEKEMPESNKKILKI